jgi:hypothetical protein
VREWHGAQPVGRGPRWLILLLAVTPISGGRWLYTYSIAPGLSAYWVTGGTAAIISPYDNAITSAISAIAASSRHAQQPPPMPDTRLQP